jgi:hypothetical protein
MPVSTLTVTGTWVNDDGSPASGRVEFKPNAFRFINSGNIVAATSYNFPLDAQGTLNGAAGVDLVRNLTVGDAGGYTVTEFIEGIASYTYQMPDAAGPVDLSAYA